MPFSKKSLEFLFENRINDNKDWFHEHETEYKNYIKVPFAELLAQLDPMFKSIDSSLVCEPKCISRIYRDIRFSKDKSLFRDNLWVTISTREKKDELPCFYFEISQHGFEYGCGFYNPSTATMDSLRDLILSGDKSFKEAQKILKSQDNFVLGGELYKRNHYPQQSEELCNWLNRRSHYIYSSSKDYDMLFSDKLADKLKEDFIMLEPVYGFFSKAQKIASDKSLLHIN